MRRVFGFLLLLVLSAAGPGRADAPGDAELAAAEKLVSQQKYAEAAPALQKLILDFPKHPKLLQARLLLGESLVGLKKPDDATRLYHDLLAEVTDPSPRAEVLLGLAQARIAAKDDESALRGLSEAFRVTEYDDRIGPPVAMLLGRTYYRLHEYEKAAPAFYRVTRWPAHAEAPQAYFMVGESYRLAGNLAEAAQAYSNASDRHPETEMASRAALNAADLFLAIGRPDDAERQYTRIIRAYTDSAEAPRAQVGLGRVAMARKDYPTARAAFQAATLLFPKAGLEAETGLRIGDSYLEEKSYEEARKQYGPLLTAKDPAIAAEARYSLAVTYLRQGQARPAAEALGKLAADRATGRWSQLARLRLAEAAVGRGDDAGAAEMLRTVLAEKPEPALRDEASLALGEALVRQGNVAAAEPELKSLLLRAPSGRAADRARIALARARTGLMDPTAAAAQLGELLKQPLDPELRAAALAALGDAELRAGHPETGAAALQEVIDRHPEAPEAAGAARLLLRHLRDAKQDERADALEKQIATRYGPVVTAPDRRLDEAETHLRAGRAAQAAPLFTAVLETRPDRSSRLRARAGLAEAAVAAKRPDTADEQLRAILQESPAAGFVAALHLRLGRAYERQKNLDRAAANYRSALTAGADEATAPGAMLALARILSSRRKPAEAEPLLRDLTNRYPTAPEYPDALYALAWCCLDQSKPEAARPLFERLADGFPKHRLAADASFRVGEAAYDAGEFSAAAARYRAAAAGARSVGERAGYKLGWALRQLKDHAGAARAFAATADRYPKSDLAAECRVRAGEAYLALEDDDRALAQFQAALKLGAVAGHELNIQAKVGAATVLLMQGQAERARALAEPLASPANGWSGGRAQLVRAEALFLKEGAKAALGEYLRAATLYGRYTDVAAEAQFRAAECYQKLGDAKAAKAAWQRVVDLYGSTEWAAKSREKLHSPPASRGRASG
jgi:TolA-binding protein